MNGAFCPRGLTVWWCSLNCVMHTLFGDLLLIILKHNSKDCCIVLYSMYKFHNMVSLMKTARIVEWLPPYEEDTPVCIWLHRVESTHWMVKLLACQSGIGTMETNQYELEIPITWAIVFWNSLVMIASSICPLGNVSNALWNALIWCNPW